MVERNGAPAQGKSAWWVPVATYGGEFFAVEVLDIETPKPDWPWPSIEWRHLGDSLVLGDEEHQVAEGFQVPTVWVNSPSDKSVWVEMEPLDSRHTFAMTGSSLDLPAEVLSEILSEQDRVVREHGEPSKFELWAVVVHSNVRKNVLLLALAVAFEKNGWDWNVIACRNEGMWLAGQGVDRSYLTSRALLELGAEGVTEYPEDMTNEPTESQKLRFGFHPYETSTTLPAELIAPVVALFDSPLPLTVDDIDAVVALTDEPTPIRLLPPMLIDLARFILLCGDEDEELHSVVTFSSAHGLALSIQEGSEQVFVAPRSSFFELCNVVPELKARELVFAFSHMVPEADSIIEFEKELLFREVVSRFIRQHLLSPLDEKQLAWVGFSAQSAEGERIKLTLNARRGRVSSPLDIENRVKQSSLERSDQLTLEWQTDPDSQFPYFVEPRLDFAPKPELLFAFAVYILRAWGATPESVRISVKRRPSSREEP